MLPPFSVAGNDGYCPLWFPERPELSFGTQEVFGYIKKQLDICLTTHSRCGLGTNSPLPLPKRLLELDFKNERCRIIETRGHLQLEYAALA